VFDIASFRAAFPEFNDVGMYPDAMITFWAALATAMIRPCVWKTLTNTGIQLYVAHEITLAAQNNNIAGNGGVPGGTSGPISSKAIGGASVSYDTQQTAEAGAGYWNLSTYGKQLYDFMQIFGAGAIQL
jgi:hypothetical protein